MNNLNASHRWTVKALRILFSDFREKLQLQILQIGEHLNRKFTGNLNYFAKVYHGYAKCSGIVNDFKDDLKISGEILPKKDSKKKTFHEELFGKYLFLWNILWNDKR